MSLFSFSPCIEKFGYLAKSDGNTQEGDGFFERSTSRCRWIGSTRVLSEDIPVPSGMEDIVKVAGRLRHFERVQQRIVEQAVCLDPCGRVQQQTVERTGPASTAGELR